MAGAPGTPLVVVVVVEAVAQLEPCAFTARNCTWYVVPSDKPVIEIGLVVTAGEGVTHVVPPLVEYS